MAEGSSPGMLERIAAHVAKRLERLKRERPPEALKAEPLYARVPGDFAAAFEGAGPRVIAEVKFASPSEGFLRPGRPTAEEAVRVASGYLDAGAAALSILTERNFFAGEPGFLSAVRGARPEARLLMKDFFIDPYQFDLARACGADAVLLIAALLGPRLAAFREAAEALGLTPLVEVHTSEELEAAHAAGAKLIGVNSRDLRTLKTDLGVARALAPLGRGKVLVAESGMKSRAELDELSALGYKGFLIGTSLMKAPEPGAALAELFGPMNVKICGLTREEDVRRACALGAWAAGFILAPSPRRLTQARAKELRRAVTGATLAVGVFVDAPRRQILRAVRECGFDAVQLHGREAPEHCAGLPVPVLKGLSLSTEDDLARLARYGDVAAHLLVEPERTLEDRRRGVPPAAADLRACWSLAARAAGRSIVLAGGLSPENAREAADTAKPFALDVSAGVESAPGVKDPAKLEAFFAALRQ